MAKTDGQFYDEWVGRQTPDEFIEYSEITANHDIEDAVSEYVDEQAKDVDSDDEDLLNLDEVKNALVRYIKANCSKEEIRVEFRRLGQEESEVFYIELPAYMLANVEQNLSQMNLEVKEKLNEKHGKQTINNEEFSSADPLKYAMQDIKEAEKFNEEHNITSNFGVFEIKDMEKVIENVSNGSTSKEQIKKLITEKDYAELEKAIAEKELKDNEKAYFESLEEQAKNIEVEQKAVKTSKALP